LKTKKFGGHVAAFDGRRDNRIMQQFIGCVLETKISAKSPELSEWLTIRQARELAACLVKAADYAYANNGKKKLWRE
jgi:hypothetical protein